MVVVSIARPLLNGWVSPFTRVAVAAAASMLKDGAIE